MNKHAIAGYGQIGRAIGAVVGDHTPFEVNDRLVGVYDVLHVCFPYSKDFIAEVKRYQTILEPLLTIIHSTVPIGTTAQLNHLSDAVHSPVRGKHPDLEQSVRTFVKFFGGPEAERAAKIFGDKGVPTICTPKSETTEALKLFDTEQYHINILAEKAIHAFCKEHDLDFDVVYTQANMTYNTGYDELGMPQYTKYVLEHMDGPIGGHCVMQNSKLLSLLDLIKKYT